MDHKTKTKKPLESELSDGFFVFVL